MESRRERNDWTAWFLSAVSLASNAPAVAVTTAACFQTGESEGVSFNLP